MVCERIVVFYCITLYAALALVAWKRACRHGNFRDSDNTTQAFVLGVATNK